MIRMLSTLACTALALCTLLATACQPNLENNAQFQDKVAFINRLDEQIKSIDQRVDRNGSFLKQIADNMKKLNAESRGGANDAVAALEQRVQGLENSLKTANDTIVALETRLKDVHAAQVGAAKAAPKSDSAKTVAMKPAQSESAKTATKEPAKPRVTGKYHQVKAGETIKSIAKEYKIPEGSLTSANHLPQGSKLIAGQRVFVPGSAN
jgi:LysM repeat protein